MLLIAAAVLVVPVSPAGAAGRPKVEYLGVSAASTTGATVETRIDPEGGETTYEFALECQNGIGTATRCGSLTVSSQPLTGVLPAGSEPITVAYSVNGLQPDYYYEFGVAATNAAGREGFIGAGFYTCPLEGPCNEAFMPGGSLWLFESGKLAAARTVAEVRQQEAEKRAVEERERRQASERAERGAAARGRRACVVPRLKGRRPGAAARALEEADCSLGALTQPDGGRGALVVIGQSIRAGRKLPWGSSVGLTLGHLRRR